MPTPKVMIYICDSLKVYQISEFWPNSAQTSAETKKEDFSNLRFFMPRTKLAISYNFPHFLHRDSLGVPFQLKDKHGKPDLFLSLINITYSDIFFKSSINVKENI